MGDAVGSATETSFVELKTHASRRQGFRKSFLFLAGED
jgi:hypothetical protein